MEGIFKAHLVADRFRTEPVATGPATVVRQSEMYATATGGPVLIGPVQSSFGLFFWSYRPELYTLSKELVSWVAIVLGSSVIIGSSFRLFWTGP